jgi:type III restriction enzyme
MVVYCRSLANLRELKALWREEKPGAREIWEKYVELRKQLVVDEPQNMATELCTLREITTERQRRQTIGRGLRLPVRENGERCFDQRINRLTVIASESFKEFARRLQDEMRKECGVDFEGRILNKRERRKAVLNKQRLLDPDFQILWDKIKHKTRYAVNYSTSDLVSRSAGEFRGMPEIKSPFIRLEKGEVQMDKSGLTIEERRAEIIRAPEYRAPVPDLLGYPTGSRLKRP